MFIFLSLEIIKTHKKWSFSRISWYLNKIENIVIINIVLLYATSNIWSMLCIPKQAKKTTRSDTGKYTRGSKAIQWGPLPLTLTDFSLLSGQ